jgi:serine/threonine protein kinase
LADFGITSELKNTSAETIHARGTPGYRAPELLFSERYDVKVDIWALGCILHELVTGKKPFANDWSVIQYRESTTSISLGGCPLAMASVFQKMIQIDPGSRPTAADISRHCLQSLASQPTMPTQTNEHQARLRSTRAPSPPQRHAVPSTANGSTLTWATPSDRFQPNPTFRFSSEVKLTSSLSSVIASVTNRDNSRICVLCSDFYEDMTVTLCDTEGGVVWEKAEKLHPSTLFRHPRPSFSSDGRFLVCFLPHSDEACIVYVKWSSQPSYKPRILPCHTLEPGKTRSQVEALTIGSDGEQLAICRAPSSGNQQPKIIRDSNSTIQITPFELDPLSLAYSTGDRFLVLFGKKRVGKDLLMCWEATTLTQVYHINLGEDFTTPAPIQLYTLTWANNPAVLLRLDPEDIEFTLESRWQIILANKPVKFNIPVKEQILAVHGKQILSLTADGCLCAFERPESGEDVVQVVVGKLDGERPDLYKIKAMALSENLVTLVMGDGQFLLFRRS